MLGQFEMLEEGEGRTFAPSTATKLLVRGKEATLGHFVVSLQILEPRRRMLVLNGAELPVAAA